MGFWELAGAGAAVGGTSVWSLAAAARVGVLRLLLEVFPRVTWDAVTWGLIPAFLLAPAVLQGVALAFLAGIRPVPLWRTVAGSVGGTVLAMAVFGGVLVLGVRRLPPHTVAAIVRTVPELLIAGFGILLVTGWLLIGARLVRIPRLRRAAVPVATTVLVLIWIRAHGHLLSLAYVLDRPEVNGFFASVAIGGALGAAWAAQRAGRAETHREGGS